MTTIDQPAGTAAITPAPTATDGDAAADATQSRRGLLDGLARYLPAEITGTAVMVVAGQLATLWTDAAPLIAMDALLGEIAGFYAVLAVTIYLEVVRITATRRRALGKTGVLLIAEFGAAEALDTLLVRPAALVLGVWLFPDPLWGMLLGKIAADIVFYAAARYGR